MPATAGLVLAAGAGRRFGGPKAVALLDGERLVDRAVRTLAEGGADPVYVVAGAAALDVPGAAVIANPDWVEGMGSSLRAGLAAVAAAPAGIDAVVVVLVDQPGLSAVAVARLLDAVVDDHTLAVATYVGRQGHPVVIGRAHWPGVTRSAVGDRGARAYLQEHVTRLKTVECSDIASDDDVDEPAQLEAFRGL